MLLAVDHHYPSALVEGLVRKDLDVVAIAELGWQAFDDVTLLASCAEAGRALLTNNVADFAVITRSWQLEGRSHAGLIFTSDAAHPRTRSAVGRLLKDIARLMRAHPEDHALRDRVTWLSSHSTQTHSDT